MNLNNTDFLEAQMEKQAEGLRKRVIELVRESGLTGVHRSIYEAGIEAGLKLIPDIVKESCEVFAQFKDNDTEQVKPS